MKNSTLPFTVKAADYEDKIDLLSEDEFFSLFQDLGAEPKWGTCGGKRCIKLLTLCHHGTHHNAAFDPESHKVTCFSDCSCTVMLHTWVKRALDLSCAREAKNEIEKWIDGQGIDLSSRDFREGVDFSYHERPFDPDQEVEMVQGIDPAILAELYSSFDTSPETLSRLVWCKPREQGGDGIPVEQLRRFQVACDPARGTIILPHHNANGDIVGLYERSFLPLRRDMEQFFLEWCNGDIFEYTNKYKPEIARQIYAYPKSKYMPLLKAEKYRTDEKPCWSFPNGRNLYGLHLAKEAIRESGKAIIFEGAKSVMLAHAYGYPYAVASHTFGAGEAHIAMLIQAGAKEIILAFDKQYKDSSGAEWAIYDDRTRGLAQRVGAHVTISRICDKEGTHLAYKDAPIDQGKDTFDALFAQREILTGRV